MGKNLAKAPLVGILYGTLLWFMMSLLPRSESYRDASAEFTMSMTGLLLVLAVGVIAALAYGVFFAGAQKGGVLLLIMAILSGCGIQWVAPALRSLLLGEVSGAMTRGDVLFQTAGGCAAVVVSLVLAGLLYGTGETEKKDSGRKGPAASAVKYKVSILGLLIRLVVLPLIFFIFYYLLWYFLFWRVEVARVFHGADEMKNFMGEVIDILVNQGSHAAVTLLTGFAYGLFSLPMLFRMQEKRVLFIAANTLLYLSAAAFYLIPSPVMPDAVRMAHLLETGVLMLLYGVLSGLLLHTAIRKEENQAAKAAGTAKSGSAKAKDQPKPAAQGAQ